jgi:hypothetical protein
MPAEKPRPPIDQPPVQTDHSAHFDRVPDVEADVSPQGWISLQYRLDGWLVLDQTIYVSVGSERETAAKIIEALQGEIRP